MGVKSYGSGKVRAVTVWIRGHRDLGADRSPLRIFHFPEPVIQISKHALIYFAVHSDTRCRISIFRKPFIRSAHLSGQCRTQRPRDLNRLRIFPHLCFHCIGLRCLRRTPVKFNGILHIDSGCHRFTVLRIIGQSLNQRLKIIF